MLGRQSECLNYKKEITQDDDLVRMCDIYSLQNVILLTKSLGNPGQSVIAILSQIMGSTYGSFYAGVGGWLLFNSVI